MDFNKFEQILRTDPKFSHLQDNPNYLNNLLDKMRVIGKSGKIKDECMHFLRNQRDLDRYAGIAKKIAKLEPENGWVRSIEDASLKNATDEEIKTVYEDDLRTFAYQLDVLTNGKHSFYEKADKKLKETNFQNGGLRSSVGCYEENGQLIWYINVDCSPLINNRTAGMHEILAHSIDEKNLNHIRDIGDIDQFNGEIVSLFIDKISADFLASNYPNNTQLIEGLKTLRSVKWNNDIMKAKESYLDLCICKMMYADSEEDQEMALQEILNGFGSVWGPRMVDDIINKIYDAAVNPRSHFDPMYEFRYIVGEVISESVYKQNIPLGEKIDKMATLNDNIKSLSGIRTDSEQSPIDAVTQFLGVDNLEQLIDNYAQDIMQKRTESYRHV